MSIYQIFCFLIGKKQIVSKKLRIMFHNETRGLPMHGKLRVSHIDKRLDEALIRFTFVGIKKPPQLTPEIIAYIWEKAEIDGYVVHALEKYGGVMDTTVVANCSDVVSTSRIAAETAAKSEQYRLPQNLLEIPRKSWPASAPSGQPVNL